jgi:hypothetical protein
MSAAAMTMAALRQHRPTPARERAVLPLSGLGARELTQLVVLSTITHSSRTASGYYKQHGGCLTPSATGRPPAARPPACWPCLVLGRPPSKLAVDASCAHWHLEPRLLSSRAVGE